MEAACSLQAEKKDGVAAGELA